ncbi:MauE/DoxX family redox-associated membrane protein [Spongorhabdus nitratireducens]
MGKGKYVVWILSVYVAFIFIQSLFFKFTDAPETVHIFGILGEWSGFDWFAEYGAYGVGIAELIASLLLFSAMRMYGAAMATGIMAGAVFFHLFTPLGIEMPTFDEQGNITGDDGGLLFINACAVLVSAFIVFVMEAKKRFN